MRRTVVVVIVMMVLGQAAPAGAHHASDMRRLRTRLAVAQDRIESLTRNLAYYNECLTEAMPVSQFGGYVYRDGAGERLVSALDIPNTDEEVGAWVSVVEPSCLTSGRFAILPPMRPQLR